MTFEDTIEALKNLTTGKYFILLEEGVVPGRVKVINPEGHIISVADRLFDPEPQLVERNDFNSQFTELQLQALSMFNEASAHRMDRELEVAAKAEEPETKERTRRPSTKASKAYDPRDPKPIGGRIAAEWSSPQLTFYRHKIEPLRPSDRFRISVEGEGDFVITKQDFMKIFNNVSMDPIYRSQGIFKFQAIPDDAVPFFTKK